MIAIANALHEFWSGFGIKAYREGDPRLQSAELPYIVYNCAQGQVLGSRLDFVNIYYPIDDQQNMYKVADAIKNKIDQSLVIQLNVGNLVIYRPDFQQRQDTDVSTAIYCSFQIDYNTL